MSRTRHYQPRPLIQTRPRWSSCRDYSHPSRLAPAHVHLLPVPTRPGHLLLRRRPAADPPGQCPAKDGSQGLARPPTWPLLGDISAT